MYLKEYDFECAISMGKDAREKNDPVFTQRAVNLLRQYQDAMRQLKAGDRVEFGSYFLSNSVKPVKTLVRAPIVWLVLENTDGQLLLLTEHSLDWEAFGAIGACSWSSCYLRKWLNGDCMKDWFAEEERALMKNTVCRPEKNQISGVSDEEVTHDRLFLLTFGEALQYFNGRRAGKGWKNVRQYLFEKYTNRYPVNHQNMAAVIPLAERSYQDKRVVEISYEPKEWWLRTPGTAEEYRMVVCPDGSVNVEGVKVGVDEVGVRPAMWLDTRLLEPTIAAYAPREK